MHTLFLLNPAAGKADCTRTLPQQIAAAAAGAGLAPEDYTIRVTTHAGHARELSRAAAAAAQKAGVELHIFTFCIGQNAAPHDALNERTHGSVCVLNVVKQHHCKRLPPHGFGQSSAGDRTRR